MKKIILKIVLPLLLLGAVVAGGVIWWNYVSAPEPEEKETLSREEVALYFLDVEKYELARAKREIAEAESSNERIFQIIEELKKPPETEKVVRLLPEDLQLLSAYTEGDIVYVDFNEAFIGAAEGSTDEMLFLYSIVNSLLANLPEKYKLVQFTIEGEMRPTMGPYGEDSGHIGIKYPLGPRWIQDDNSS
ncbi:MAG: GerMN domain-containing protein [bacterium]